MFLMIALSMAAKASVPALRQDYHRRVYLAGPLFNAAERAETEKLAQVLEQEGFLTFVPHRDGFLLTSVRQVLTAQLGYNADLVTDWTARAVDALDVYQVVAGTGSLVANINGRVPDEGTIVELTMAWMLGKPVILLGDDSRSLINGINNPLLMGRGDFQSVSSPQAVGTLLKGKISEQTDRVDLRRLPESVAKKVKEGEILWLALTLVDDPTSEDVNERTAKRIADLYGPPCGKHFTDSVGQIPQSP